MLVALLCAVVMGPSCQDVTTPLQVSDPNESIAPSKPGKLVVHVYWDAQGVPDKRVEVLELHLTAKTDAAGYAIFEPPSGRYTVRAYDINRGGPATRSIDTTVTITPGKETRVEVFDCLPCV
jgi:uncharacterized protein (DUF2141 family)